MTNANIDYALQQIARALHTEIVLSDDHAWLIPVQAPETLLTLTWLQQENISILIFSLSLGGFDQHLPASLAMNMLTINLELAVHRAPKLNYSPTTKMITLLESLPIYSPENMDIDDLVRGFVAIGNQIRIRFHDMGYPLLPVNQGE
ncbi:type III secretion system chaperone [Serratia quinivorans]|uniref:type III secretion system chaperone n=1 Tax=Serratia quinivorans TaxID=137545 RepID=UPI00217784F2|nr:type III secretion system chaperone [Serratia quinivorans]CAI1011834.1 Uncharacterised protein [Serratia quinivorans]CAI1812000.1 Uncharacterised protein [Serratia quinivorans]